MTPGPATPSDVLWSPPADVRERSRIGHYLRWLEERRGLRFAGYDDLWEWSVTALDAFWTSIWEYLEVGPPGTEAPAPALAERKMPGARWFPTATLNYAAHLLSEAGADGDVAVLARSQSRGPADLTAGDLRRSVAAARAGLARLGVGRGDRVVAYLPNIPETLVAFLATASLGAVWASCAPEFGTRSVLDRFTQIDPTVLLAVDGYRYGAKPVDRSAEVAAIREGLPGLAGTVAVPYLDPEGGAARLPGAVPWAELVGGGEPVDGRRIECEPVPFDHPLYVLYSSGTTGLPKPIVHGHGGILLEHAKQLALAMDLGPGDRFFWFSTTGWMMWNLLVSGLAVGSAVVLFDGDLASPDLAMLWHLAEETGTTYFGASAPFLLACRKAGLEPAKLADLSRVRGIGSTGAPLPPEGFRWVYEAVTTDGLLNSTSGGTDVCSAFVGSCPLLPVREGRISGRALGAKVEAFDPAGRPVIGEQGELVLTEPMPSMPVGFWGDDDGSRYRAAYFDDFPGVWRHGDWIVLDDDGSCVISGRSDSTLNRGGVRLGTSEFYSVVESFDEVADSLVVHLEDQAGAGVGSGGTGMGELLLFVVPAAGVEVDDDLERRIAAELRRSLSPRHVPDAVYGVAGIPRTLSGKKLEVPVKRILTGTPAELAASRGALANPDALDAFERLAADRAR